MPQRETKPVIKCAHPRKITFPHLLVRECSVCMQAHGRYKRMHTGPELSDRGEKPPRCLMLDTHGHYQSHPPLPQRSSLQYSEYARAVIYCSLISWRVEVVCKSIAAPRLFFYYYYSTSRKFLLFLFFFHFRADWKLLAGGSRFRGSGGGGGGLLALEIAFQRETACWNLWKLLCYRINCWARDLIKF